MVDDGREVGGSPELQLGQTLLVGTHHALDACNPHTGHQEEPLTDPRDKLQLTLTERISWIKVNRKLVGNLQGRYEGDMNAVEFSLG